MDFAERQKVTDRKRSGTQYHEGDTQWLTVACNWQEKYVEGGYVGVRYLLKRPPRRTQRPSFVGTFYQGLYALHLCTHSSS
jgi:hypothetical protein